MTITTNELRDKKQKIKNEQQELKEKKIKLESEISTLESESEKIISELRKATGKETIDEIRDLINEKLKIIEDEKIKINDEIDSYIKKSEESNNSTLNSINLDEIGGVM